MTFPDAPKGANKRPAKRKRRPQKARIHTGGVPRLQHWRPAGRAHGRGNFWVRAMRYIERILQPGEKLLYSGTIHWVIYMPAVILSLIALALLTLVKPGPTGLSWLIGSIVFWLAAGVTFVSAWFKRWTTEIDVTDRRIVYKRGFVNRHTVEMNMDKVESVDVDQSIIGRLFDFGDITVKGTGESMERMHNIGAPLDFRNQVTAG